MKLFLIFLVIAKVSGIFIKCEFKIINFYGPLYTCNINSIEFADNSTHITGYSGIHLEGYSSEDVGMIYASSLNITKLPKGFLKFFPNFISFYIIYSEIDVFNGDELVEYPNLEYWEFKASNLERIPGNFFSSTPKIKFIDFSTNKIKHVGESLLNNLNILQQFYFFNNVCASLQASNPSQFPALIEALRVQCPDLRHETTTNLPCRVDEENLKLRREIDELKEENLKLKAEMKKMLKKNIILNK